MKITDLEEGQYCTRDNWGNQGSRGHLCIGMEGGKFYYFDRGEKQTRGVRSNSTAYGHSDFRLCDKYAKKVKTMKYEDTKVIVLDNKSNQAKGFDNEDKALEYIEDMLEINGRTKFIMYKPYQKIEPKRTLLKDLIQKIGG